MAKDPARCVTSFSKMASPLKYFQEQKNRREGGFFVCGYLPDRPSLYGHVLHATSYCKEHQTNQKGRLVVFIRMDGEAHDVGLSHQAGFRVTLLGVEAFVGCWLASG